MATYKVIQDIEAEDKLIGPFGIRQFIYLIIVFVSGFIMFKLVTVAWFLAIPLLPHTLFFALLALPFGGEQPTETWLLAKIRFLLKPRRRIWNQTGIQNLVTITAPKKEEKILMNDMSEGEIRSRLSALANTIDSRGWAIKNVNINVFSQPAFAGAGGTSSDRLVEIDTAPQQVPDYTTTPVDDMLDEQNNPTAQSLDRMINAASKAHRDKIINSMRSATTGAQNAPLPDIPAQPTPDPTPPQDPQTYSQPAVQPDYWFLGTNSANTNPLQASTPGMATAPQTGSIVMPDPVAANQQQSAGLPLQPLAPSSEPITEEELLDKIHAEQQNKPKHRSNLRVIKTLDDQQAEAEAAAKEAAEIAATKPPEPPVTPAPDPDIIELARNDDLNVETVARQAKKSKEDDLSDGEVVINLH